ncbi:MAG: hypothetical protein MZV70_21180 [Desulfobacterales bacterium]|nr:hypothetical protein [Desulfobacterales bacterium]
MRETPAVKPARGAADPHGSRGRARQRRGGGPARHSRAGAQAPLALEDGGGHRPGQGRVLHLLRAVPRPELRRQRHRGAELHAASDRFALPAVQSKPAGELFKSVSYGIPGGRQPPLETTITIDDRWSVVAFVKSLGVRH